MSRMLLFAAAILTAGSVCGQESDTEPTIAGEAIDSSVPTTPKPFEGVWVEADSPFHTEGESAVDQVTRIVTIEWLRDEERAAANVLALRVIEGVNINEDRTSKNSLADKREAARKAFEALQNFERASARAKKRKPTPGNTNKYLVTLSLSGGEKKGDVFTFRPTQRVLYLGRAVQGNRETHTFELAPDDATMLYTMTTRKGRKRIEHTSRWKRIPDESKDLLRAKFTKSGSEETE